MNKLQTPHENKSLQIINQACEAMELDGFVVAYSGGYDSLAALLIAMHHPKFEGVIHADTNTGPIAHRATQYALDICQRLGVPVWPVRPVTTYTMLIVEHGHPGPAVHSMMYRMLKERPLRQAMQQAKAGRRVRFGVVTGVRRAESTARINRPEWEKTSLYWINPLVEWTKIQVNALVTKSGLPRNPNAEGPLDQSGECGCGAHAFSNERRMRGHIDADWQRHNAAREKLVEVARELQLIEVELGMRDPNNVIAPDRCVWGAEDQSNVQQMDFGEAFFICQGCTKHSGTNPDYELHMARTDDE